MLVDSPYCGERRAVVKRWPQFSSPGSGPSPKHSSGFFVMSLRSGSAWVTAAFIFCVGHEVHAQEPIDSSAYASFAIDSGSIRRLPLVRESEVASFLPRTSLGLRYYPEVRGALISSEVRIDGVPVENATFGITRIEMPAHLLQSVQVHANGTSVLFDRPTALEYFTATGNREWGGRVRVGSDAGMPGGIGSFRGEAAAHGGFGGMRLNFALHAQSAQSTEFNNVGDVPIYVSTGVDTTISFVREPGNVQQVPVVGFEELESDRLPGTNWNHILAGARLDLIQTPAQKLFASFSYSRLQEGQYRGFNLFNPMAQAAERFTSSFFTIGYDRALPRSSSLALRIARTSHTGVHGALDPNANQLDAHGAGPQFGAFNFLVDNDDFELTEDLIERIRANSQGDVTPFPETRSDLRTATEFRLNPYATFDFPTRGITTTDYAYDQETRLFGSAVWSVPVRKHAVKAGAEASIMNTEGIATRYTSIIGQEIWIEQPKLYAAFVEDLFDFGPLRVQAGLRFDVFDNGAEYPETPGYISPDGSDSFVAESQGALSPRLAIEWKRSSLAINGTAGRAASPAPLYDQYRTTHADWFRFGNALIGTVFSRPLDLVQQTYANVNGAYAATSRLELTGSFFWVESNDIPAQRMQQFEDPTNPGSFTHLRIIQSGDTYTRSGFDAGVRYGTNSRNYGEVSASFVKEEWGSGGNVIVLGSTDRTANSVTALAQFAGPSFANGLDFTIALRALSPPSDDSGISWLTRLDGRVAYGVNVGGVRGSIWLNAFRLGGSSQYMDNPIDADARAIAIESHRATVGGGMLRDVIDLNSLGAACCGVLNEVDLYLLQQAEARFGNGDRQFTAAEQTAAFGEAYDFGAVTLAPLSQQRRLEFGIELSF